MVELESSKVPYHAEPLRGEKLLVIAPHPDDEVIGCGGIIALHRAENRSVTVVVVTDGVAAEESAGASDAYRDLRERECAAGLAELGASAPQFLRFRDRRLDPSDPALQQALASAIREAKPDLLLVPSPIEVHPDHLAVSGAFGSVIQSDTSLAMTLPLCRVGFYEVSHPIRPNAIVDITSVAERKYAAIAMHESQTKLKKYDDFARGLNRYRSLTLGPEVQYAEAFWVTTIGELRTTSLSNLSRSVSGSSAVEIVNGPVPVSVVVRTKNRPAWLREALASIASNNYPAAEIVVVNDGGASIPDLTDLARLKVVEHAESAGRSAAMNRGVAAASNPFIAFLDDDDLFYPEHLSTLATAVSRGDSVAYYTDAVSSYYDVDSTGAYVRTSSIRAFAQDYDSEMLRFDNYIPLPTLLVRKDDFHHAGGFDPAFDLFEDWDFLLRLSSKGSFLRIPKVTCEVRHFAGSQSMMLSHPEGTATFQAAKLAVWKKHGIGGSADELLRGFELMKRSVQRILRELGDASGSRHHLELDVARLERDKVLLLEQLTDIHREVSSLTSTLAGSSQDLSEKRREIDSLTAALGARDKEVRALHMEVARLDELLETIYRSRTWKLHEIVDRMKGLAR